jgi:uncharacterized OB-fold protein
LADERDRPWSDDGGTPTVLGVRCAACGATLFPPQHFGCTACGARGDQLLAVSIPATGTLNSYAMVHRHQSHPTPYMVGEVVLDAGPMVRSLLAPELSPRIGQRVQGALLDDGQTLVFTGAKETTP